MIYDEFCSADLEKNYASPQSVQRVMDPDMMEIPLIDFLPLDLFASLFT